MRVNTLILFPEVNARRICAPLGEANPVFCQVTNFKRKSQVDLSGKRLGNYCIIFGKVLSWDEVKWQVQEAYGQGIVDKSFTALREFGSITIRVNAKNNRTPPPKPLYYFRNGDNRGITTFVKHWKMCRNMGRLE